MKGLMEILYFKTITTSESPSIFSMPYTDKKKKSRIKRNYAN